MLGGMTREEAHRVVQEIEEGKPVSDDACIELRSAAERVIEALKKRGS